ncbi:hypothetical protein BSY16_3879 [Sinorhizobium sp. RAC02]|nr:hypothetical protein BSY16_3879 [Sinorhizobium sp. RAC02]
MLAEKGSGRRFASLRQAHRDLAAIVGRMMTGQETVPFQAIEKPGYRCARHACPFGQLMRGKSVRLAPQQEQQDKPAFGQLVRGQARGTIAINCGGQRQQFKTKSKLADTGVASALRLLKHGAVFLFNVHKSPYSMAANYVSTCTLARDQSAQRIADENHAMGKVLRPQDLLNGLAAFEQFFPQYAGEQAASEWRRFQGA